MTDRIEYAWDLDGFCDEQRYYCSLSPINVNNPPTANAVISNSARTYIDTDVVLNEMHYARFSSVKNGVEKFSDEISTFVGDQTGKRYCRLYITQNNGGQSFTTIQEIELSTSLGGADITTESTIISSSSNYMGYPASRIIDNDFTDPNSCWVSAMDAPIPHIITIDFGYLVNIKQLKIWPQPDATGLTRATRNFKIQASADGTQWSDVQNFTGVTGWSINTTKVFKLLKGEFA